MATLVPQYSATNFGLSPTVSAQLMNDARRQAVLLLGGDKGGTKQFYATAVPRAEQLWKIYVSEMQKETP